MKLLEDEKTDGDEIDVVWTKNMMNGGRSPWLVVHRRRVSERASKPRTLPIHKQMGNTFLFRLLSYCPVALPAKKDL